MVKAALFALTCAALLWASAAQATPTETPTDTPADTPTATLTATPTNTRTATPTSPLPQQRCDAARITAWKTYVSCTDSVVAKDAKGVSLDKVAAFAKCRHTYFGNWAAFQTRVSFAGSTCIGSRFTDNGDGTVTDNLSRLIWEEKDNLDGTSNGSDPHDGDNTYTWSTGSNNEDGTAFAGFLAAGLNTQGFAGTNDWRLPTLAELQTIEMDFACFGASGSPACSCGSSPCIDGTFGPTQGDNYWSATSYVPAPSTAWHVNFSTGDVRNDGGKTLTYYVRAVRGGL